MQYKWKYMGINWRVYKRYNAWCIGLQNPNRDCQNGFGCVRFDPPWPETKKEAIKRAKEIFDHLGQEKVQERVKYGY